MRCRHTVAEWHRFTAADAAAVPIFAACRLLIKDGDRVGDPRTIACNYWGHQEDCPVYDGPGKHVDRCLDEPRSGVFTDEPTPGEAGRPVRSSGDTDRPRVLLIGLSVLSVALLIWAAALGLTARGGGMPEDFWIIAAIAATVSIVTHVLAFLRIWARR
jgi:hypothetical protein